MRFPADPDGSLMAPRPPWGVRSRAAARELAPSGSQALLDRIDMHLVVPPVAYRDLVLTAPAESSAAIRARVEAARLRQRVRFDGADGVHANAHMSARDLRRFCPVSPDVEEVLRTAITRLSLSARAYHRVLKIARTIGDLAGADDIGLAHVREAIQYRSLDRGG